jgi:hypothetical protein
MVSAFNVNIHPPPAIGVQPFQPEKYEPKAVAQPSSTVLPAS